MEILILVLISAVSVYIVIRHIRSSFKEDAACRNCRAGERGCCGKKKETNNTKKVV